MQYRKTLHTLFFIGSVMLVILANPFLTRAQTTSNNEMQNEISLTAIPPRLGDEGSLFAKPGETVQTRVRVRNSSKKPLQVRTFIEDFIIGEDGRTPIPVSASTDSRWSLSEWMTLSDNDQVIPAGGSHTINVVIQVPENALPGGRYAMIMHEPRVIGEVLEQNGQTTGQTGIAQRVGTLLYLRVAGDVKEEAFLRNIKVPSFREFGPTPIQFSVENLSDVHITPKATIIIRDMFGFEQERLPVGSQNIFPFTMREFSTNWDRIWGYGRYSAEILVEYGTDKQIVTETVSFWLFPLRLFLALLTLVFALIGVGIAIRRHRHHVSKDRGKHISLLEERMEQLKKELGEWRDE